MNNDQPFKQLASDCDEIYEQLEDNCQDIISWLYVEDVFETRLEYLRVYIEPNHSPIDNLLSRPLQAVIEYLELPPTEHTMYKIEFNSLLIKNEGFSITYSKDSRFFRIKRLDGKNNTRRIPITIYSVDFLKIIDLYSRLFRSISILRNPLLEEVMNCIKEFFKNVKRVCEGKEVSYVK